MASLRKDFGDCLFFIGIAMVAQFNGVSLYIGSPLHIYKEKCSLFYNQVCFWEGRY